MISLTNHQELKEDGGETGAGKAYVEASIAGPLDLTGDVDACR